MEIIPIGLRGLSNEEYTAEINTHRYEVVRNPAPYRHAELNAFVEELQHQQAIMGVEVMCSQPIAEGQAVSWRASCPGLFQLIRVIGYAVSSEHTSIPGWRRIRVKPRFFSRSDVAAAERIADLGSQAGAATPFAPFRFAGAAA